MVILSQIGGSAEMQKKPTKTKWSVHDIKPVAPNPSMMLRAKMTTVVSECDRVREINRLEADRILFWE